MIRSILIQFIETDQSSYKLD